MSSERLTDAEITAWRELANTPIAGPYPTEEDREYRHQCCALFPRALDELLSLRTRLAAVEAERDALVARDVSTMPVIAEARRMVERNMPGCGGLEVLLQRMDTESASRTTRCAHDARTKEATDA